MKETQPMLECQLLRVGAKMGALPSSGLGPAILPFGPYDPADTMISRPKRPYGINYVKIFRE